MRGRIISCMTIIHGDLISKSVAPYCYPDLYVPVLDRDNRVKDSYPDLYVPGLKIKIIM
jgi:hypothetical protein